MPMSKVKTLECWLKYWVIKHHWNWQITNKWRVQNLQNKVWTSCKYKTIQENSKLESQLCSTNSAMIAPNVHRLSPFLGNFSSIIKNYIDTKESANKRIGIKMIIIWTHEEITYNVKLVTRQQILKKQRS